MPANPTALAQLADMILPDGLERFVRERRQTGMGWERIARDLRDVTDKRVDVATITLVKWAERLGWDEDVPA